jgi:hypothetical protein
MRVLLPLARANYRPLNSLPELREDHIARPSCSPVYELSLVNLQRPELCKRR